MKKIRLFLMALITFGAIYGCSSSDQQDTEQSSGFKAKSNTRVVSPSGYVIAESSEQFAKMLFDDDARTTQITNIEYFQNNNSKGAVAQIDFVQNGVQGSIGFSIGDVKVTRTADVIEFVTRASGKTNFLTFRCRGSGCCRSGGYDQGDTHVFTCKCDGNPDQNQGCTMYVSQNVRELYLSSGH